ncbi:PTS sugar transporter subunit IIC [[Clostridium] innocuum]|nr:PTS sugar transporter subunit IIC [[Clostridium] innocuum]
MELSILQIVFITLIAYLKMTDTVTTQLFAFNTIICGWLTGLVVQDPITGLSIGATMQLMSMGVVAVGGSSMPDYPIAAIIATTIAVTTGKGMEAGLAIGLPVAMLGVNFDVIYKIFNGFLMRKETSLIEEGNVITADVKMLCQLLQCDILCIILVYIEQDVLCKGRLFFIMICDCMLKNTEIYICKSVCQRVTNRYGIRILLLRKVLQRYKNLFDYPPVLL